MILQILHRPHFGTEKTKARARSTLYWPGMSVDIERLISKCHTCLTNRNKNQKEPLQSHEVPVLPWLKVGTDLFDFEGIAHIVVIDYYSNFIETMPIKDKSAATVINSMKSIFTHHGIPQNVISDKVPYNSGEFTNFATEYGFSWNPSSPRYPQSNGKSEMAVKIVKRIFKKCDDRYLGLLEYANSPITGTTYSPSQLLTNRSTRTVLPVTESYLQPNVPHDAQNQLQRNKIKQAEAYDKTATNFLLCLREKV